jgi:hypothetical protein
MSSAEVGVRPEGAVDARHRSKRRQWINKGVPARERRLGRYGDFAKPAKSVSGHAASKHKTHIRLSIFLGPGGFFILKKVL